MDQLSQRLGKFASDESGVTAIEYALIASFIFLGLVPLINMMGGSVGIMYDQILGYFDTALGA
ncbi:MAG: Flp family type IVb pilin [Parvibaculaceae bacterium]